MCEQPDQLLGTGQRGFGPFQSLPRIGKAGLRNLAWMKTFTLQFGRSPGDWLDAQLTPVRLRVLGVCGRTQE